MNLKNQRRDFIVKAQEILAKADVTAEDLRAVEEIKQQVATIDERLKAAGDFAALADSLDGGEEEPAGEETPAKSLGEHFFKHAGAQFKSARGVSGLTVSAPEYVKANTDVAKLPGTHVEATTDYIQGFTSAGGNRLFLRQVLGDYTISGNTVTYWEEPAIEGDFDEIAESGTKAQLHPADPVKRTESLSKIAGFWTATDEMLEDEEYLVSVINNTLMHKLRVKEENLLLNGTGSTGIKGLLNREGVQTLQQGSGEHIADTIFKAITKIALATDLTADALVMNPADWEALRLGKDSNGQYYGGGYFTGAYGNGGTVLAPSIWGIAPVLSPRIAKGTVLVGAFKGGAQVAQKGGLRLESTNSHADNFVTNRTTFRLEQRELLMVPVPSAFVKVTAAL